MNDKVKIKELPEGESLSLITKAISVKGHKMEYDFCLSLYVRYDMEIKDLFHYNDTDILVKSIESKKQFKILSADEVIELSFIYSEVCRNIVDKMDDWNVFNLSSFEKDIAALKRMINDKEQATEKFTYSINQRGYNGSYKTKDEAIKQAIQHIFDGGERSHDWRNTVFYIGVQTNPMDVISLDVAEVIMEHIGCQASERFGDFADDWLNLNSEIVAKLERSIAPIVLDFILDNDPPTFYGIDKVEMLTVSGYPKIVKELEATTK